MSLIIFEVGAKYFHQFSPNCLNKYQEMKILRLLQYLQYRVSIYLFFKKQFVLILSFYCIFYQNFFQKVIFNYLAVIISDNKCLLLQKQIISPFLQFECASLNHGNGNLEPNPKICIWSVLHPLPNIFLFVKFHLLSIKSC